MRIDSFQSLERHFGAKAVLCYTSYTHCDICTIPTSMSKALALGLLPAPCQRAWCNQSSWLIYPMGLDYRLLSILNIPEAIPLFLSEVYLTDKYTSLPHKEAQFFLMYST